MAVYEIEGNHKLAGKIKIGGNKNSVLPIMAACLLTSEKCILQNVPKISDVQVMANLLKICGVKVAGVGTSKLTLQAQHVRSQELPPKYTDKLRASILIAGPLLRRTGEVKLGYPGGDVIGRRPLDSHIQVFESLGANIKLDEHFLYAKSNELHGSDIFLQEASVTATENAIMAAVLAQGETTIKRAASEPHVVDLCNFLVKMGAKISGIGSNVLKIKGVTSLSGTVHTIRPDHIEVGTFAILAAVTSGKLEISPIIQEDLKMILLTLTKFNVKYKLDKNKLIVEGSKLKATEKVVTDVWPGFPTDLMAPMIVLASQADGVTILHDWMYESRMFFVDKLLSMGAKVEIADPHRVLVYGPTNLIGKKLDTPDIRAGMALVIAALHAKGKSKIEKAELIERGYENITQRLKQVGAKIEKLP